MNNYTVEELKVIAIYFIMLITANIIGNCIWDYCFKH